MSRIVGVDCGTSLRKYAWRGDDGKLQFRTCFGDAREEQLLKELIGGCCVTAQLVGIGERPTADCVIYRTATGDVIDDEVRLQAEGVRQLLKEQGMPHDEFLVASVGTGTSYAVFADGKAEKLPFGNPIGGGFISGLSRGAPHWVMADLAAKSMGDSLDLLYKHVFPEKEGSAEGEFVISHFARKVEKRTAEQYYASVLNTVAVAVARDLLMYRASRPLPQQVAFIGTCVSMMRPLALLLQAYAAGIGFTPTVPVSGEYSAAIGALLSAEAERAAEQGGDIGER